MSKTMETKNRILEILLKEQNTLTDMSKKLGLTPPTVSQHLKELYERGAVQRIENTHFRKLKYYGLAPGFRNRIRSNMV